MTVEQEYDVFVRAADTFVDLVGRIDDSAWTGPGLGEWDLRALVGHTSRSLITVTQYVERPAASQDLDSPEAYYLAAAAMTGADQAAIVERGLQAGAALGSDPAATVADLAAAAITRLHGQADILITTVLGGMWLSRYLPTRTFELVVHGDDIAQACGLDYAPDPEPLAASARLAGGIAAASGVAVEMLAAVTGRRPLPANFSLM